MRFEWDAQNTEHVAAHGLTPKRVEEIVLAGGFVTAQVVGTRIVGHGTLSRCTYRVVFDLVDGWDLVRVVTAFQIRRKRVR